MEDTLHPSFSTLKFMRYFILLFVILFFTSMTCKKRCHKSIDYDFEHPVSIYPIKDTFCIGDTLWIDIHFSDIVRDLRSGNSYKLVNFDFCRCFLDYHKIINPLDNLSGQLNVGYSFNHTILEGTLLSNSQQGIEYKYSYTNNQYRFKSFVVIKDTGKYVFAPAFLNKYPPSAGAVTEVSVTGQGCEYLNDIYFPVNRQADGVYKNNYYLFQKFMNEKLENNIERIKTNTFTFVVVK